MKILEDAVQSMSNNSGVPHLPTCSVNYPFPMSSLLKMLYLGSVSTRHLREVAMFSRIEHPQAPARMGWAYKASTREGSRISAHIFPSHIYIGCLSFASVSVLWNRDLFAWSARAVEREPLSNPGMLHRGGGSREPGKVLVTTVSYIRFQSHLLLGGGGYLFEGGKMLLSVSLSGPSVAGSTSCFFLLVATPVFPLKASLPL